MCWWLQVRDAPRPAAAWQGQVPWAPGAKVPGASLAAASKSLVINKSAPRVLFFPPPLLKAGSQVSRKTHMSGSEEAPEDSQASAGMGMERASLCPRVGCGLSLFT